MNLFFELMFKLPLTIMSNSIELFSQSLQGWEDIMTEASKPSPARRVASPPPAHQAAAPPPSLYPTTVQPSPEPVDPPLENPEPPVKEKKMSYEFSDDNVTTAQYQVLFVKRDYEAILQDTQTVVTQTIDGSGFVAWRIADFVQLMTAHGVVLTPSAANTLRPLPGVVFDPPGSNNLRFIDPNDNQYLRVEYQILSTVAREDANYDEDQTKALEEIARKMPCTPPPPEKVAAAKTAAAKK